MLGVSRSAMYELIAKEDVPVTGSIDASGRLHREELPLSGDALELMTTTVMKIQLVAR